MFSWTTEITEYLVESSAKIHRKGLMLLSLFIHSARCKRERFRFQNVDCTHNNLDSCNFNEYFSRNGTACTFLAIESARLTSLPISPISKYLPVPELLTNVTILRSCWVNFEM